MNKVLIVLMFILLGTSLIVVSNMGKDVQNSFIVEYQNNKNMALPDIDGKQEITTGIYSLFNDYGVTVDYNFNTGIFTINGTYNNTVNMSAVFSNQNYRGIVTAQMIVIGGIPPTGADGWRFAGNDSNDTRIAYNGSAGGYVKTANKTTNSNILVRLLVGQVFDNFQFKLQLEKGEQATSYVVPKLIPMYKDNLTQQEKNEIGIGAFGGISKILKTINDIIKPVGDFINGLLNMF